MAERIYIGSGKERSFDNGGSSISITIDVEKLISACKEHGFTPESGKRYIKLKINTRREVDQYGNTHSVEVDTWKPDNATSGNVHRGTQKTSGNPGYQNRPANARNVPTDDTPPDFPDDIPF